MNVKLWWRLGRFLLLMCNDSRILKILHFPDGGRALDSNQSNTPIEEVDK